MGKKYLNSTGLCPQNPLGGHFWICDPQDGPVSEGHCKYCGAVKVFWNSFSAEQETTISRHHGFPVFQTSK